MNLIIRRLSLAGLLALPAACATYPQQYYDSGSGYYAPASYSSGYGVIERNYYSTYAYPTPVYRTETYHYHDDHGHYDGYDRRYPDRRYQDTRRFSAPSGTAYRRPDSHEHGTNDYYNWNAQTAKRYDTRKYEGNRSHDHRDEGWQGRRPDEPNAHGQWQRQQNMERQAAKRENKRFAERLPDNRSGGWQHPQQDARNEGRQRRPDEPNAHGQWRRQQNQERKAAGRQNNGFGDNPPSHAGGWQAAAPAQADDRRGKRSRQFPDRSESHSGG